MSVDAISHEPLKESDAAHFARRGWVFAPGFYTRDEARDISRWTDEILAQPEFAGGPMVYRESSLLDPTQHIVQRIENFCPHHQGFNERVRGGRLLAAIEQLLGAPACLFKDKINFKLPGGGGFEPHQDQQAGWSVYAPLFVTALVSIDQATIDNGCLEIGDGKKSLGLIGEEWRPLTQAEMAGFELVPIPTEPGDVIFFDSYAPHGSKPNLSDTLRRILYLTYNRRDAGDHRARYFADKRANFPPDIERIPGKEYRYRV